jgi:hypothetical protein
LVRIDFDGEVSRNSPFSLARFWFSRKVIGEPKQTALFGNLQVSILIDIPSVSAIIAAASVIIGFAFTYLQIRNLAKTRRTELRLKILDSTNNREFLEAGMKVMDVEFKDQKDFEKKYGLNLRVEMALVLNLFDGIGELLRKGLTDYETVSSMPVVVMWEKLIPFVEGARKAYNDPSWWANFEYFYNEAKKRQLKRAHNK